MTHLVDEAALSRLDAAVCLRLGCLPLEGPALAFAGAADREAAEWITYLLQDGEATAPVPSLPVHEHLGEALDRHLALLRGRVAAAPVESLLALEENDLAGEGASPEDLRKKSQSEPVVKLVDHILDEALRLGATDIHVEPSEDGVAVRLRRDGMLREHLLLPTWVQMSLVSRIKILAELDISEKRLPQDGRIALQHASGSIDVRASTLPTRQGEKVVLRLLRQDRTLPDLAQTGMPAGLRARFEELCDHPQGMIVVTGPTGSGKTSTLFAALHRLLPRAINVTTIEDPVEYRLKNANQVQVNEKAGLTFAGALRSILRQDPDVILVGEIRDSETASIALQAAQTGHLVFTTLHTNDSAGAVTRLIDLGIPPFLAANALLGVLAQRLVRKLCPHCRKQVPPSTSQLPFLAMHNVTAELVWDAVGCLACEGTGYHGRTGIFELLMLDDVLREAVAKGATEGDLRRLGSLTPLVLDGIEKVLEGTTSLTEVLRVGLR